jgi:hypothetical protein
LVTRFELVLLFLVLFGLTLLGMRSGWRSRARRQASIPALPEAPTEVGADLVPPLTGLYVGTTTATRWQDRIVAQGLGARAYANARLVPEGALIERQGNDLLFIPIDRLIDARLEPALAGKVVGQGGLLVLRWRHGDSELDTGLRGDDKSQYPAWLRATAGAIEQAAHQKRADAE